MESKKNPKLDYRKTHALFFNIGLVLSLLLVIYAFEWKFVERIIYVEKPTTFYDEELPPPVTEISPPKPKVQVINLVDIPDDLEIEEPEYEPVIVFEPDEPLDVNNDLFENPVEETEEIFIFAETMPSFEGGISEFYKFVSKNLKYPAQARRIGIEGKVFVHFVVDKDGSLSDIKVVRGLGAGCDEEVMRIINMSPKWNPGKQRGRPVRVQMMLPIAFRLQ